MLTATPLVSNLSDLKWVCRFLQRPQELLESLPPKTFAHKNDVELGMWQPISGQASEDGNERKAIFTPVADPFRDYQEYSSYVHSTTKGWDKYIMFDLNNAAKIQLLQRKQNLNDDKSQS